MFECLPLPKILLPKFRIRQRRTTTTFQEKVFERQQKWADDDRQHRQTTARNQQSNTSFSFFRSLPSVWLAMTQRVVTFCISFSRRRAPIATADTSLSPHCLRVGGEIYEIFSCRLHRPIRPVIVNRLWRVVHMLSQRATFVNRAA